MIICNILHSICQFSPCQIMPMGGSSDMLWLKPFLYEMRGGLASPRFHLCIEAKRRLRKAFVDEALAWSWISYDIIWYHCFLLASLSVMLLCQGLTVVCWVWYACGMGFATTPSIAYISVWFIGWYFSYFCGVCIGLLYSKVISQFGGEWLFNLFQPFCAELLWFLGFYLRGSKIRICQGAAYGINRFWAAEGRTGGFCACGLLNRNTMKNST